MALEGLKTLPKFSGGSGLVDGVLAAAMAQLQGLRCLAATSVAAVTAGAGKSTLTLSSAASPSVQFTARLPGEAMGVRINVATTRSATDASLYDLEVWSPDTEATPQAIDGANATNDTITFNASASPTYVSGDGPVFIDDGDGNIGATPFWLILPTGSPAASLVYKLATTKARALAGTALDITSSAGATSARTSLYEAFPDVSNRRNHRRYVEEVVNVGRDGGRPSDAIRALNRSSMDTDPRPVNTTPTPLAGGSASELTLTGIHRGDAIAAVVNLTNGTVYAPDTVVAVAKNQVAILAGNTTSGHNLVALVLPK